MVTAVCMVLALWSALLVGFRRPLLQCWREPAFRHPIAILESDDWGAGPATQAAALTQLRTLLSACRNRHGESPVMTVGVVLEVADRDAMRRAATPTYVAARLDDAAHADVLAALREGAASGTFALQLHGLAHYWTPSLMSLASTDEAVAAWLAEPGLGWTEALPSTLQSRWTDVTQLPSAALPDAEIARAAAEEATVWQAIFGSPPTVAVPTTFIWNTAVEEAWAAVGVRTLVTPGSRHDRRDADGRPAPGTSLIRNGERGAGKILLLVRDVYFEPALGHRPERLAQGVAACSAVGRPALIEMHRFNFCGPRADAAAFATLHEALTQLLAHVPLVRFMSTARLADIVGRCDPAWIETSSWRRAVVWARRARELRPFARLARWSGLMIPLRVLAGNA